MQVGVHGCHSLISDRNVFKSQDSSLQVGFMVGGGNMVTAFHTASGGSWLLSQSSAFIIQNNKILLCMLVVIVMYKLMYI